MKRWKKLFASGNPDVLQGLRYRYDNNNVSFTDDYNVVKAVSEAKNDIWVIATIADPDHPLKNAENETGFFFNEARKATAGEFISDAYISTENTKPYEYVELRLAGFDFVESMLGKIESGEYTIKYKEWSFFGGRDADQQCFKVYNGDGGFIAELKLSCEGVTCHVLDKIYSTEAGWVTRKNLSIADLAESIIRTAMERDDKEFVTLCTDPETGEWGLPCGSLDITREEFISDMKEVMEHV